MRKYVDIDDENIVYCTFLYDGRIEKVLLKSNIQIIYVCDECETVWFSL